VNLFRKSADPSSPPAQLPVLYEPPVKPSAAPKATEIESLVRAAIWGKLSPEPGRVVGLTVPELLEFCAGARRLSSPDVMALARAIGVVNTPETGVDILRRTLTARMNKRVGFDWLEWPGGGKGEENLRDFMAGADCLTLPELNHLCREFYGKHMIVDPDTAMLKSTAPPATPTGPPPPHHRGGSNVPSINQLTIATLKRQLTALEALEATQ
jgi:hypothetical protein